MWQIRYQLHVVSLSNSNALSLSECRTVVEKAQVKLNWVFPFIARNPIEGNVETFDKGYQGISDLGSRREIWRMHTSEHFYMLNAFIEDWMERDHFRASFAKKFPSGEFFFFNTSLLDYITQLFAFIERLTIQGLYKEGVRISIRFGNMSNRQLYLESRDRIPFFTKKTTGADNILLEETYSFQEIMEDSTRLSSRMILKIAEYFQYSPSPEAIIAEQIQFLQNR